MEFSLKLDKLFYTSRALRLRPHDYPISITSAMTNFHTHFIFIVNAIIYSLNPIKGSSCYLFQILSKSL